MTSYAAPLADMRFVLAELDDGDAIASLPGLEEATPDLVDQVLEEAGKFAAGVLAPLNEPGDNEGSRIENGVVRTPDGFADAYSQFVDNGWHGLAFDPAYGGQGLPIAVATLATEMFAAANMSFALCPLLTQAAVKLLTHHGSAAQKAQYLAKLVSGEWCATMCMTEPQAGSDIGAVKTRAVRDGDRYRVTGTKIFITYGEHDMAPNIIHFVLARTPDAPPGVHGLSLFLVPKIRPGKDGQPGPRNDLRALSLEHKLGINASPTCVMAFGEDEGAVGHLIGKENHGIECMFTMMNNARLDVGLQGIGVAERAYQRALAYARERRQGRRIGDGAAARLIDHADVRRMLMTMKAQTEAMRSLACRVATDMDTALRHPDANLRAARQRRIDLLTPVVKGYCSETGFEVASLGVQVHGGMGYIEETGAAQHLRDARITMIYEGTTGIQALDLARRKLTADDGLAVGEYTASLRNLVGRLQSAGGTPGMIAAPLTEGTESLDKASEWLRAAWETDMEAAAAGATDYLRLFGIVACGGRLAEAALKAAERLEAGQGDAAFYRAKLATARFFAERILPQATALVGAVTAGATALAALDGDET